MKLTKRKVFRYGPIISAQVGGLTIKTPPSTIF